MNAWGTCLKMMANHVPMAMVDDRKPSPHSASTVRLAHKANLEKGMRTTMAILEVVRKHEGRTLRELALLCEMGQSNVHYHLHKLASLGLAHRKKSAGARKAWGWVVGDGGTEK